MSKYMMMAIAGLVSAQVALATDSCITQSSFVGNAPSQLNTKVSSEI